MSKKNKADNSKSCRVSSIGGQAVMEGVMMRGPSSMAIAVRDAEGVVRLETSRLKSPKNRSILYKIPVIRGILNFFSTFVSGIGITMRSAEVFGESEPTKFETWLSKKLKIDIMTIITIIALLLGIGLAIGLFVVLPTFLGDTVFSVFASDKTESPFIYSLTVGLFKICVLVVYMLLVSLLKDIKRTFMYHGAEHKTITCYEKGEELTIENVQKCSTLHNRCGTTFLFFVIFISIIVFAITQTFLPTIINSFWLQTGVRILLMPLVAGLAYELLKFLAKHDSPIWLPLKMPGLLLQKITTKQPDDKMIEIAIASFKAVLEMENDSQIPTVKFIMQQKIEDVIKNLNELFIKNNLEDPQASCDWIVSHVLNVKRSEINSVKIVSASNYEKILNLAERHASGEPLQYVIGDTEFYGYKIKTDKRVLIPRFDTEYVVESALKYINKDSRVLDMCTGSGCIAIAIKKLKDCEVVAVDVSQDALDLAKENANINSADITFIHSDLFSNVEGKFDVVISNPPYVSEEDYNNLAKEIKHEPKNAFVADNNGFKFYEDIINSSIKYLNIGGKIVLESGDGQAEEICQLFNKNGNYTNIEIFKDINGKDRIVKAEGVTTNNA